MRPHLFHIDTALITARTVTRRFREGEGQAFYNLVKTNEERLRDYFPLILNANNSPEASEFFIRQKLAAWLEQKEFAFGIWHQEDQKLIGYIVLKNIEWSIPMAEVVYFIDADYTEKRLATEAMQAVVKFAFQEVQLQKLFVYTPPDNTASRRLLMKMGFRPVGTMQQHYRRSDGITVDMVFYELTMQENKMLR